MADTSDIKLTITFIDPDLDEEEKEEEVAKLLTQIKELDEVEEVTRVQDPNPPQGNKSLTGWLAGKLMAFVKPEKIKQVFGSLIQNLANKSIEVEAEANGKKIKVKASNLAELEAAVKAVENFVNQK
ncbi:hypothetical protein HCG51_31725 [Tolypothrix sp. PCC 7910]|uniref:hypothetical protein n=1 Tax=Tolypothrix sp. PCC 7910 TaxID=2099387 RepID=UPI00142797AD|nr:hypothetical protein [Tolypothrix sp. PCC 7910]QIR40810.1 hypothetical protein HCG51_31725 [Tolypothrix sp. PCC 7910]